MHALHTITCKRHSSHPFAPRTYAIVQRRKAISVHADAQQAQQLPPSLQKIVTAFHIVPDPMARYKQLLFYAAKLPGMAAEDHIPENKVEGCVSQVRTKRA